MKTLTNPILATLTFSLGCCAAAIAAPNSDNRFVNAYGEPAGFANLSEPNRPDPVFGGRAEVVRSEGRFNPGTGGLYYVPGTHFDRRNFESLGSWQARVAAESAGTVIIGPLEVLDSGPTGPMAPEALSSLNEQVTTQVLTRIEATDKIMASLKRQMKSKDDNAQASFDASAREVKAQRQALRENLKTLRAAGADQWSDARVAVAVSFNAYVQSMRHAREVATGSLNS